MGWTLVDDVMTKTQLRWSTQIETEWWNEMDTPNIHKEYDY